MPQSLKIEIDLRDKIRVYRRQYLANKVFCHGEFKKYIRKRQKKHKTAWADVANQMYVEASNLSAFLKLNNIRKEKCKLNYAFWLTVAFADNYNDAIQLMEFTGNTFLNERKIMSIIEVLLQQCDYYLSPIDRMEAMEKVIESFNDKTNERFDKDNYIELKKHGVIKLG